MFASYIFYFFNIKTQNLFNYVFATRLQLKLLKI